MRNCFVYQCDRQHKDDPRRTMFNVPKDPQKFEEWRQALPKHRPLRPHDRVCEKHFKSTDIQRDWTYHIAGKTKKLLRTKPVLRPDAIPCIFNVQKPGADTVPTGKRRRKKSPEPSEENVIIVVESTNQPVEHPADREQSVVVFIQESETIDVNRPDVVAPDENGAVELPGTEMDIAEKESIFGELYDNIFEVELPSTLWGVHREPDRNFVAFSRFGWCLKDGNVSRSVSLLLESALECRAWYDGKLVLGKDLTTQLASSHSDQDGNPVRLNLIIVKLLDNLEQYAAKEALFDVAKVKESLEDCLRSDYVQKSSNNDAASSEESVLNKDQL